MRSRLTMVGLIVPLGLTIAGAASGGECLEELKARIKDTSDVLVRATLAGDDETVLAHYTDDVIVMPSYHGIVRGKPELIRYHQDQKQSGFKFQSMDFTTQDLWTGGDLVYEIGKYAISFTTADAPGPIADAGKYMTVWQQQDDGSLKIKVEMWNTDFNPWAMMAAPREPVETAGQKGKCPASAADCLTHMAKNLPDRGIIGLDGDWDDAIGGYRIKGFAEGTTAKRAGVLLGDLLVRVNGIPLKDAQATEQDIVNRTPGREVTIRVLRDGAEHDMTVTLMAMTDKMIAEEVGRHMLDYHVR